MTQQLVIPQPDAFGLRVTRATPLAKVVAVLRQHNPRASYAQIRAAAERLMLGEWPEDVQSPRLDRFDSTPDPTAVPSAPVDGDARAVGSGVAAAAVEEGGSAPTNVDPDPAQPSVDEQLAAWQPERSDVAAWIAKQKGLAKGLSMSNSGRIPAKVLSAYREAHRDEYLASLVPVRYADGSAGEPMPAASHEA